MTEERCRLQSTFVATIGTYDMEAVRCGLQPEVARPTGSGPVEAVDQPLFLAIQSLNHRHGAGGGNALRVVAIEPPIIGLTGSAAVVIAPKKRMHIRPRTANFTVVPRVYTMSQMTKPITLNIPAVDWPGEAGEQLMAELRERLSPRGDIVSEMGRQRTVELFGEPLSPQEVVARICGDVDRDGLPAVLDYTTRLDGKKLTAETLRATPAEMAAAHAQAQPAYLATLRRVVASITEFQSALLNRDVVLKKSTGGGHIELRQRYLPLRRVGICIPGGAAAYPSTLLMTAVPARVAGVREIAVVVPPTPFGGYNNDILAACHELGIAEVYRIGGAQGVAALAYGVTGIERVDKIVGPGNLFVALAKRHVYGAVDIDSIAGPSEVVVLADESARPDFLASDLISQAEHSPGSAVLITWHSPLIPQVQAALEEQLSRLDRGNLARASLEQYGALVLVPDAVAAARLSDSLAPEHLHISTAEPEAMLARVQNAGAIFLGHHTPVAVGDYVAGPSHVLPTGGTARFANGLCANDFLKRSSVIAYDRAALQSVADDIRLLAAKEGLTAHSASVDVRFTPPT